MLPASVMPVTAAPAAPVAPELTLVLLTHATEFSKSSNTGLLLTTAFSDLADTDSAVTNSAVTSNAVASSAVTNNAVTKSAEVKVRRLCWSRVAPDTSLLAAIAAGKVMVLYPTPSALPLAASFPDMMPEAITAELTTALIELQSDANINTALPASRFLSGRSPGLPPTVDTLVLLDATWQLAQKMWNQSPYLQSLPTVQLHCDTASSYRLRRNQKNTGWCTAEATVLLLQALDLHAEAQQLWQLYLAFNSAK